MAKKTDDAIINVEERWIRIEHYAQEHRKPISIITGIIVAVALGYSAINFWYIPSQESEGENAIYHAQTYFTVDSLKKAINGDGTNLGLQDVADQYSWTPVGKLANYYLGLCYYERKDYQKAIDYLDKFNAGDILVSPNAVGVSGDAEMQLGHTENAIDDYNKAVKMNDNDFTAPIYLMKAALAYESKGDYASALTAYQTIKTKYSNTEEAQDIDKYIARAKTKSGVAQ
jgi:tetratricopeptide (TPR) repeat protein